MPSLATDDEYRARWVDFHMADGTIVSSRRTNWRNTEWEKVVKLTMWINGAKHEVDCMNKLNFKGFLNFRVVSKEAVFDGNGKYKHHEITNIWVIGWTDGRVGYLKEVDFKMGHVIREYQQPLKELSAHIHPRIKKAVHGYSV